MGFPPGQTRLAALLYPETARTNPTVSSAGSVCNPGCYRHADPHHRVRRGDRGQAIDGGLPAMPYEEISTAPEQMDRCSRICTLRPLSPAVEVAGGNAALLHPETHAGHVGKGAAV